MNVLVRFRAAIHTGQIQKLLVVRFRCIGQTVNDAQNVLVHLDVSREDTRVVTAVIALTASVHVVSSGARSSLVALLVLLDICLSDVDVRTKAAFEHFVKLLAPRHPSERDIGQ